MPRHQESRILPYSADQMFDLVAAIDRYPEFLPWCKEAHLVSFGKDKITADLVVGTKLFHEKFTSEVTLERPRAIIVHYRSGPLAHLSNKWLFTSKGRKKCQIDFEVDFDFRSSLLRAAMNVFFDKALRKMVGAFEEHARFLYG